MLKTTFAVSAAIALSLVLASCAPEPPPPPQPTSVALSIDGKADMNNGNPTRVFVYYLNSDANFIAADYFALIDSPEAALGADLVTVDEYLLQPGDSVQDTKTFDAAVPHIGAVAALRDIDKPGWKANSDLQPRMPNAVGLTVDGSGAKF